MANVGYATLQIIPSVRGIGNELRRQLVGPAEDAGDQAGEAAGGGFADTFKGALAAIGVAAVAEQLGAQFTEAFTAALEQGSITKTLSAQLGSTGRDAARQGEAVGTLFAAGVTDTFEQGAEAVREVVRGGLVPPGATLKQLGVIGTRMTDVANTFGTDMNLQGQAVAAMLKNGLAPNAEAALDVITAGFQKLGPNAEDLLETFQEYSVQLRKLGLDSTTALGLFQQGIQGGARDTDILADAFKEFSILAIDMSQSSQDAYKALGLDAEKMSLQISRGGEGAAAGLQLVLDRLRATKDPVKQNAAAVGLFGTQAEDLGAALFALDPSKAAAAFGTVDGAAKQLGETLRSGPSHEIKVFTRTLKQGLVDFIGGQVIPVVMAWASAFTTVLLPPITAVGSVLGMTLVPVLAVVGAAFSAGVSWLREYGAWLLPLGVAVAGLTITLNASAIATGAVTAVFAVYRGVILAAAAVTRGYAIVQGLLNAVMAANPIGLIITGIAALVTLLVVAYQNSDTFRAIVQGTWAAIQAGWSVLWESYLKPGFAAFMVGLRAVGDAALWLWQTILSPVFSAIWTAAKILFAIVVVAVVTPIILAFKVLAAIGSWLWKAALKPAFDGIAAGAIWLWDNALKPTFDAIGAGGKWLWDSALKPAFDAVVAIFKAVGVIASWLWTSVLAPTFQAIGAGGAWMWTNILKPAFSALTTGMRTIGTAMQIVWRTYLKPAFDAIGAGGKWLWDNALKPVFDKIKAGAKLMGAAFGLARDAISKAWDSVVKVSAKPVNFIIRHVYTEGIKAVWDKVAGFVGLGKLPDAPKMLARGGRTSGGIPGKDSIPALLMADEYVIKRSSARSVGFGALEHINRTGELPPVQRFADGGIVGWLGDAAKKVGGVVMSGVDFLSDPGRMWETATKSVRDLIAKIGQSGLAKLLAQVPGKMLGGLKDKVLDAAKGLFGGSSGGDIGGSGVQRWSSVVLQALQMVGQSASLLPVVLRRMNQESGGNPAAINNWDINAKNGTPSKGLMQVIDPTFNAYAGALRGRGVWDPLANIYASMRYALSRYGSLASAYNRPGGYANGGQPRPGEIAWVGERGPELVRFGSGNTEVFDHDTSMRMAAGLGVLRGFAKGTSGARAVSRPELKASDLSAFTRSLTGSASAIGKAAAELVHDLRLAGGAGAKLAGQVSKTAKELQGLASKRDQLSTLIATAREAAAGQKQTAVDFLGLSNLSSTGSVADLITGMEDRQNTLQGFQSTIRSLSTRGLNQDAIRQLVAMGPDSSLAELIAGGSAADIRRINELTKSGGTLATSFGNSMADAMYDSGKDAAKGFLTGLISQQKDLQAEMTRLGASLIQGIKVGMGLAPAGPTAVMNAVPRLTTAAAAQAAMPARRAVNAAPRPRPAAAAGGLQAGDRLALRVGDRELDAIVENVVVDTLVPVAHAIAGRK